MTRRLRLAAAIALAAALAWSAGFIWFVRDAAQGRPPPPHADGIVALTGGAGRVDLALHLLAEHRAERLLVSGIGGGAALAEIAQRAGLDSEALSPLVTLGRDAADTHGNAAETAAWARRHKVRSLIVVTAGYHMRRALTELGRAMPGVTLHPAPVQPPAMRDPADPGLMRLMAEEYTKWLITLGLARGLPGASAAG